jgi:SOS response regulatory protein OraA/RecX
MRLSPIEARQRLADFLRRRGFDWEMIQATKLWEELGETE